MKRFSRIGLPSIFVIIGLVIMALGGKSLLKASASESWPTTKAVVKSSEIESYYDRESRNTTYGAEVIYEYVVDGNEFVGDRVKFGKVASDYEDANYYLKKYPKGKSIVTYYNSADPSESILEPGIHSSTWFKPIFGFVFTLFGSLFVFMSIRNTKGTNH